MVKKFLTFLNKTLPKYEQAIIVGFPNTEGSAIEVANYISSHYKMPVFYVVSREFKDDPKKLLLPDIILITRPDIAYLIKYMTSKYVFFTHGSFISSFSKRQVVTNIWHGIFYKRIGILDEGLAINTDITVATSPLTQKMFAEAFDVPEENTFVSGYPRNDILINAKNNKTRLKNSINENLTSFDKVIIWLPTFRKSVRGEIRQDGKEIDNPFYIADFDVAGFNQLLKEHNVVCLVKPHPMAPKYDNTDDLSNLLFINDEWISQKGITLYHLTGCSDMLISDVSSVIIDYLLLDQPIICVSTDFEEYKKTRGFYFDDIEHWIPSKVIHDQQEFFNFLQLLLSTGNDPYEEKRKNLKNKFFTYHDALSTERLVKHAFAGRL